MRLFIIICVFFSCMISNAQENKNLTGKTVDITYGIIQGGNNNSLIVYLDGYKMGKNEAEKIGNQCLKCKITFLNDSTVYINSRFIYFIDNVLYKKKDKYSKLKTINTNDVYLYELLTEKEAEKLGIIAKYGLIQIKTK